MVSADDWGMMVRLGYGQWGDWGMMVRLGYGQWGDWGVMVRLGYGQWGSPGGIIIIMEICKAGVKDYPAAQSAEQA